MRSQAAVDLSQYDGQPEVPPTVQLEDGLTEQEAVALALWNNAAFHETLARLGLARGDLIQAGLLTNPSFLTLFPVGPKQWEGTLYLPVEAALLRPLRVKIAHTELEQIGLELTQNGLNLVRDVKVAYVQLAYAEQQSQLAAEGQQVRDKIYELSEKQLQAGDISKLEVSLTRAEKLRGEVRQRELDQAVETARQRLNTLLGFPGGLNYQLAPVLEKPPVQQSADELVNLALQSRPDLRGAELAILATQERVKVSRWMFLRVDTVVDANGEGTDGFEIGPGLRFDIPIFDQSQGQVARAEGARETAVRRCYTLRDQIIQDVKVSTLTMQQAQTNLSRLRQEFLPVLRESVDVAQAAYEKGDTPYFNVLQLTSQYLTAREQELNYASQLQQARAELERSVGQNLDCPTPVETPLEPPAAQPILPKSPAPEKLPLLVPPVTKTTSSRGVETAAPEEAVRGIGPREENRPTEILIQTRHSVSTPISQTTIILSPSEQEDSSGIPQHDNQ